MRNLLTLARFAIVGPNIPSPTSKAGAFHIPVAATGVTVRVVASAVCGWDHVSVSTKKRCPNWIEMSKIKELFFEAHECAMQLHVPASEHINNHPYCLHLWRPHEQDIPRPPAAFVGVRGVEPEEAARITAAERAAIQRGAAGELRLGSSMPEAVRRCSGLGEERG